MKREIEDLLIPFHPDTVRHDPHDLLQSDVTSFTVDGMNDASHVLLGCPQDHGVRRNHGRPGAAGAPSAIRDIFYRLKPPMDREAINLTDIGDIIVDGGLEDIHVRLQSVVASIVKAGKTAIVLGGGNDISIADGAALAEVFGKIAAVNIDAHLDIRKNSCRHSGTPYRILLDGDLIEPCNLFEVGIQPWANSAEYIQDAMDLGIQVRTLIEMRERSDSWDTLISSLPALPLLVGFDMDSVRSADAPGVSAPSPIGFNAEEILAFVDRIRQHPKAMVFEISEVNPELDRDGCTARLAALAIYVFLYGLK